MCQCVAVSKSFWHSVYFLVWYPNRFTFLHMDSSKYYREELKRFATKTRDFRFGFVEFSKSLWLKIIQSICVQCTQTRIHILCGWCGCVMAYTFNLQFYENNCVLFSVHFDCEYAKFLTHTHKGESLKLELDFGLLLLLLLLLLLMLVLSSKNYKWMYGNEKHQHNSSLISFHFISFCDGVCVWFVWNKLLAKYITHAHTHLHARNMCSNVSRSEVGRMKMLKDLKFFGWAIRRKLIWKWTVYECKST